MFEWIRSRLSVRLSLGLSVVVVPALVMIAVLVVDHESRVVETLVLKEARTAALQGAAVYGMLLDNAVDSGALTLDEILQPDYEEMTFYDDGSVTFGDSKEVPSGRTGGSTLNDKRHPKPGDAAEATGSADLHDDKRHPLTLDDKRYHTKLGDYTDAHGVGPWQDAVKKAGGFLFASGMDLGGLVLSSHAVYNNHPRGNASPESAAWDKAHSRMKRKYNDDEPRAAVKFLPDDKTPTAVLDYKRDTGEMAWDVVAAIWVKGKHFGVFRVGVAKDVIRQKNHDLTLALTLLFSVTVVLFVVGTFLLSNHYAKPLSDLADRVIVLSTSADPDVLNEPIRSPDLTEVGRLARAVNKLRGSLAAAMERIDSPEKFTIVKENKQP